METTFGTTVVMSTDLDDVCSATRASAPADATDTHLRRAKRPESPIAGPYGHPLHPSVVAVPIGAWVTALAFDVRSHVGDTGRQDARASRDAMVVGLVGSLAAAGLGFLDWLRLTPGTKAHAYGTTHMVLNLGIVGFYADAIRRRTNVATSDDDAARVSLGALGAHVVAMSVLGLSGILGGELAYRFGVRVADEATQRPAHTVGAKAS